MSFNTFWKFLRRGNSAWDFLGVNLWSRLFFLSRYFFLGGGGLIFAPIRSFPVNWNLEYPLPPPGTSCHRRPWVLFSLDRAVLVSATSLLSERLARDGCKAHAARSLRKQSTFPDVSTGFPAKWPVAGSDLKCRVLWLRSTRHQRRDIRAEALFYLSNQ